MPQQNNLEKDVAEHCKSSTLWEDATYKNDAMPSFTAKINDKTYRLWLPDDDGLYLLSEVSDELEFLRCILMTTEAKLLLAAALNLEQEASHE